MVWILPLVLQMQQLLSHQEPVYSPDALRARIQGTVVLSYRIAKDGSVQDVESVSGHPFLVNAAGGNLATWRFEPASSGEEKRRVTYVFEFADRSEARSEMNDSSFVRVIVPVPLLDPISKSGCPLTETAPPTVPWHDSDFVELARTACYGSCPVYTVRLFADGKVVWEGKKFVAKRGNAKHAISVESARALLERFRSREVWSLCSGYKGPETDSPTSDVRVSIGGQEKAVGDYASAAPKWFRTLRAQIDEVAGTHDYVHGTPMEEPLENIRSEGLGKSGYAEILRGTDPNAQDASGWTPLMYAAANVDRNAMDRLLQAGADPQHVSRRGETVLMAAAVSGTFDAALAKLCGNINAKDRNGMTVLMYLAKWGEPDPVEAAIAAGADIRVRDRLGRTALQYVREHSYHSDELRRLLSAK